jgi:1,4-dihydroxy-2-naphthoate octaprenyltransferase
MAGVNDWVAGARPRTLWTSVSPVAVGTAAASAVGGFDLQAAVVALGVAASLQIASNYANDYADGVRGTDLNRLGPERLVASGRATPSEVRRAAYVAFAVAAALGLYLTLISAQLWLIPVGLIAIIAAWRYTASSRPYGYSGWGEVSVFIFFGPVAVLGTMLTQADQITWWAATAACGVGLWACSLLLINNIRDVEGDALAGKRTLAVRLGDYRARQAFAAIVMLPVLFAIVTGFAHPWALLAVLTAAPSLFFAVAMRLGPTGLALRPFFNGVSLTGLVYGLLLALGIAV